MCLQNSTVEWEGSNVSLIPQTLLGHYLLVEDFFNTYIRSYKTIVCTSVGVSFLVSTAVCTLNAYFTWCSSCLSKRHLFSLSAVVMVGCRRSTHQEGEILQKVMVKQSLYSQWKPISSESIKMAMKALEAAIGLDDILFQLSLMYWTILYNYQPLSCSGRSVSWVYVCG